MQQYAGIITAIVALCTIEKTQSQQCFYDNEHVCKQAYPDTISDWPQREVCSDFGDLLPNMRDDLIAQKENGVGFLERHWNAWSNPDNWKTNPNLPISRRRRALSQRTPNDQRADHNQYSARHSLPSCPKERESYIECYSSVCYGIGTDCDDSGSTFARLKQSRFICKGQYGYCVKVIVKPLGKTSYAVFRTCGRVTDDTYKTAHVEYTTQSCKSQLCNAGVTTYAQTWLIAALATVIYLT